MMTDSFEKFYAEIPSDDPQELARQLREALTRLSDGQPLPKIYRTYLIHSQALAWEGVADGRMELPGDLCKLLREAAETFVARNIWEPPTPQAKAAAELSFTLDALEIAASALAERRIEDRLSSERVPPHIQEILKVLVGSKEFLRRGEVHAKMEDPPTIARVGQILVEMFYAGLVNRINGRAQGNPNASFYSLSEKGRAICERIGLLDTRDSSPSEEIQDRRELRVTCDLSNPEPIEAAFALASELNAGQASEDDLLSAESRMRSQKLGILNGALTVAVANDRPDGPVAHTLRKNASTPEKRELLKSMQREARASRAVIEEAEVVLV